jgi:hypothetical protein
MNDQELKNILNDPRKLLDMIRIFHRLIHLYDNEELKKSGKKVGERVGLSDECEIKLVKGMKGGA